MSEKFHTPLEPIDIGPHTPLVFLVGPVQGSPDWQTPTARAILEARDDIEVASPRRLIEEFGSFDTKEAKKQIAWEHKYLRRAASFGSVVVWFSAQDHSLEYKPGRAYAQTTRLELGEVFGWSDPISNNYRTNSQIDVIVGIDPQYSANGGGSEDYIQIKSQLNGIAVCDSLDQLTEQVVARTRRFGD